ncbi:hypothetical protein [Candidatus Avelusimicrobium faecicola]|uniref:hypothetical protein n=1 Tax=Candidatus Avelusimicrobium faecicola TaxID=3416205 RepID=UPI003D13AEA1
MNTNKQQIIEENTTKPSVSLNGILQNFLGNMREIKYFFDINLPAVKNRETEVNEKFKKFTNNHEKEINGRKAIIVQVEEMKTFEKLLEEMSCISHQPLLCNSSFLILINNFEYITKAILRKFFLTYPKSILDKKEFIIEFEELCQFNDLKEVKEFMIDRHLEKVFYKSFSEQQKILQKLFNNKEVLQAINFSVLEKAMKERNLLAHNNGIITENFVKQTGYSVDSVGKKLFISKKKFEEVYQEILFFGICFLILLADKIKDKEFLDVYYQQLLFSLLEHKNYLLIKRLYENTISYAISEDGNSEVINFINYLLALEKIPEEKDKFKKLLDQYKIGSLSDHFKCSFAILKNDKKEFIKLLKTSNFTLSDWYEFPIFEKFKEDEILSKKALSILEKNTKRIMKNAKN